MLDALSSLGGQQSFGRLRSKYNDFAAPCGRVKINGQDLSSEKNMGIQGLEVELSADFESSYCSFRAIFPGRMGIEAFDDGIIDRFFALGSKVEVLLGYDNQPELVFLGYLASLQYSFDSHAQPYLLLECLDAKGMMMGHYSYIQRSESSYSACVMAIARQYSAFLQGMAVETTPQLSRKLEMTDCSDYEFIVSSAKKLGFVFYIHRGKLTFGKPKEKLVLTIDDSALAQSYSVTFGLAGLAKSVTVRGTDSARGKAITATVAAPSGLVRGPYASRAMGTATRVFRDETAASPQEAKALAEVKLAELNARYSRLRWKTLGLPELAPGGTIKLALGCKDLQKKYGITLLRHKLDNGVFTTEIEARISL